jgi:VIT1/CCC1 family predicted Fe2+/Mn2+ transporter
MPDHDHRLGGKRYVREVVFGFNDGLVSTFALVSGAAGALFPSLLIALIGFLAALSGALSMALGTYISTKSQIEVYTGEIRQELTRIEERPLSEAGEIRDVFRRFGFRGKELDMVVRKITANKAAWLDLLAHEEIGVAGSEFKSPAAAGAIMFLIFIVGSLIPILPYLALGTAQALWVSVAAGVVALFAVGAAKGVVAKKGWLRSGLEMTAVGLAAAVAVYALGSLIGTAA